MLLSSQEWLPLRFLCRPAADATKNVCFPAIPLAGHSNFVAAHLSPPPDLASLTPCHFCCVDISDPRTPILPRAWQIFVPDRGPQGEI